MLSDKQKVEGNMSYLTLKCIIRYMLIGREEVSVSN